ncbi:hypothetical protein [Kocuria marina]|uniref:hypothetical protein n=1 Tax=Kocuria marina TaxID=223184 RepID=UPI002989CC26|nr:hypothetical protein [Kocuria marina]
MTETSTASTAQTPDPGPEFQRKVLTVLALGRILGGLGTGATLALGALLVTEVSGSSAVSGLAATMNTLGAAILAIPLARLAQRRGRRISLTTGALVAVAGAGAGAAPVHRRVRDRTVCPGAGGHRVLHRIAPGPAQGRPVPR